MSIVTNQTTELIGKTPVYQLPNTNIYVKLEKYNVGGSVKDRAVLGMLQVPRWFARFRAGLRACRFLACRPPARPV